MRILACIPRAGSGMLETDICQPALSTLSPGFHPPECVVKLCRSLPSMVRPSVLGNASIILDAFYVIMNTC
jgi:hypothetical protein